MKALVIGYGRAGQRHGRLLTKAGLEWGYTDPNIALTKPSPDEVFMSPDLDLLLSINYYDIAIICTPPHLHLEQIRQCLDAGLWVMVEKPLAAFRQLDEARELLKHPNIHKAMPALNYRWHPILAPFLSPDGKDGEERWEFFSYQHRPELPGWGLPLDHLPHTLDMLLAMAGKSQIEIHTVVLGNNDQKQWVYVCGSVGNPFYIIDQVTNESVEKVAHIKGPWGQVDVDTSPELADKMFDWMYADFLAVVRGELDEFPVGMAQAVKVQELLENVYDKL